MSEIDKFFSEIKGLNKQNIQKYSLIKNISKVFKDQVDIMFLTGNQYDITNHSMSFMLLNNVKECTIQGGYQLPSVWYHLK